MKLTITKPNGTKLIKEFRGDDIKIARTNGWKDLYNTKKKSSSKSKGAK